MTDRKTERRQQILFSVSWLALSILAATYGFFVVATVFAIMFLIWFPWEKWGS